MTVLLEHYFDHHSAVSMDTSAREFLVARSIAAECRQSVRDPAFHFSPYSMLVSRGAVPDSIRTRLRCFGGRNLSRIESLTYVQRAGLELMDWATAKSRDDVDALFDLWKTDRVILKRSATYKGRGLMMFSRDELDRIEWNPRADLFCAEVDRHNGTVAKIECFGGHLLFSWDWNCPPLRETVVDGKIDEAAYLSSPRSAEVRFPPDLVTRAMQCSSFASRDGLGHISLDMMRSPDGRWKVIEMNSQEVAVWWTSQFESMRNSYATALCLVARSLCHA